MGKPTKEELEQALSEAARLREQGEDEHHVAKAQLNHDYRLRLYEQLYHSVEHYFRSGQNVTEHGKLMKILDKIRSEERHPGLDSH